jgi:O-antigen ligase
VIALLWEGKAPKLPTTIGPLLGLFTLVLLASSVMAINPQAARAGWSVYFNWIVLYVLITNIVTTEKRFFVFMSAFLLWSLKMSQHGFRSWVGNGFGFAAWGVSGAPGWFQNSGEFGIQMCIFLPLMVEFILAFRSGWSKRLRWAMYFIPVTIVASMIASSSRGALLGGAAVSLWWIARSKHRMRSIVATAALVGVVWAVVPAEQKARFGSAGDDETSVARLDRWEAGIEMANQYPVLGIGYNNWGSYYGPLSHNVFIEAWSELGYLGLLSFLLLIGATFFVNHRTRRLVRRVRGHPPFLRHMAFGLDGALIGFLTSGFFVTVLYYPYFWMNLAMTVALHVAARHESRRAPPALLHSVTRRGTAPGRPRRAAPQRG